MRSFSAWALPLVSIFVVLVRAQTSSDCNPLNATCPPDVALGVSNYSINFQDSIMSDKVWNTTSLTGVKYASDGAEFSIYARGDAPTVKTNFRLFFGQVEVIMKAAPGQGIVSSIVLLSDDLDEVDWEMIGGNDTHVQTNYFGKGNQTSFDRAIWYPVNKIQEDWHNYTLDWSREKLDWIIDGQVVRTLKYGDALGGLNYPQTPCDLRLGIWAGGDPKNPNGTIEWAGGEVDYTNTPYTMVVKSVRVSDASNATEYVYGDRSGSMDSIQLKSTAAAIQLDGANSGSDTKNAAQKWKALSSGAKIGIGASVAGVFVAGILVFGFCCIRQRKAGRHERLIEDAKFEKERAELMAYRAEMGRMRSEKLASAQAYPMPSMGNSGATFSPMVNNGSVRSFPAGPYAQQSYANSVNSMNSGRGYQRY